MATSFTCIGSTTLSGNATSVTISVPAGTGSNLMLLYKLRTNNNSTAWLRFNGDSGSNYSYDGVGWAGSGSYQGYYITQNQDSGIEIARVRNTTTASTTGSLYIPDSQTANKCVSIVSDSGANQRWLQVSGTWFNTASRVTSVGLHSNSGSDWFQSGSSLSLYSLGEA